MSALSALRTLIGSALLASGLAVANDTGSSVPGPQAVPGGNVPVPAMAPLPPVWLPMVPFPGAPGYFHYPMPQPGISWPVPYPYPMSQPVLPLVWIPVPLQPLPQQARPAAVDYGPVADTPVVKLPPFDPTPAPALQKGSSPTAPAGQAAEPASGPSPQAAPAPASEPAAPAGAAGSDAVTVDYGPVAPTPVVQLGAVPRQTSGTKSRKRLRATPNPLRTPAAATPPKPRPAAATAPAKKRMCWTRGVVAPCP